MSLLRMLTASVAILMAGLAGGNEVPELVNINTADAATLARALSGVGLKKAEAIVEYREANGRFDSPEALTEVKGIGTAIVERNADKIVVSGDTGAQPPAPAES